MSRFRIDHPTKPAIHAEAGHDPVTGFFVDVMKGHRVIKSYDFFQPSFNRARPLMGCLDFLVNETFFSGEDLEAALIALETDYGDDVDRGVRRAMQVVAEFKQAAD